MKYLNLKTLARKPIIKDQTSKIFSFLFAAIGHIIGFALVVGLVSFAYYIVMPNKSSEDILDLRAYQSLVNSYDSKLRRIDDFLDKLTLQDEILTLEKELYTINRQEDGTKQ